MNINTKLFDRKYLLTVLMPSIIGYMILTTRYSSNGNFHMVTYLFNFIAIVSLGFSILFLHHIINGKKELQTLFYILILCLASSFFSVLFFQTTSFVKTFAIPTSFITLLLFFLCLTEIFKLARGNNNFIKF